MTRPWSSFARTLPLAASALALAACGGDGGTDGQVLTPSQVAGVYNVCELRFTPTQTALPAADIRAAVMNPAPPAPRPAPSVSLGTGEYDLVYTRRSDNFLQLVRGGVSYSVGRVGLRFYSGDEPTEAAAELLFPATMTLQYNAAGQRLTSLPGAEYTVRRADYARAAGINETGLQQRIGGQLSATFSQGAC